MLRVEPFVLQSCDLIVNIQIGVGSVQQIEQELIVRHELIIAVRHVDGRQFQIIQLVMVDKPFQ